MAQEEHLRSRRDPGPQLRNHRFRAPDRQFDWLDHVRRAGLAATELPRMLTRSILLIRGEDFTPRREHALQRARDHVHADRGVCYEPDRCFICAQIPRRRLACARHTLWDGRNIGAGVEAAVNEAVGLCVVRAHAAAVGFSSVNKFYRVFKKLVGATPSEYRRRRAQRAVLSCVSSRPRAIHV